MNFRLNSDVICVLSTLSAHGYEAYIVGGSVRDMIIGKTPTDYDITTSATPEEIKAAFSGERIIETGIKHGTVTVMYGGNPYEITTYRIDVGYSDNRHPDEVAFTASLNEDLARRDFTVNAMCIDKDGNLVDIFDGVGDIRRAVIRAVGNPVRRFSEDSLRILRALRFASTLGFSLDAATAEAAVSLADLLGNVSSERIYAELKKLIGGIGAYDVITEFKDIIKVILPRANIVLGDKERFLSLSPKERLISLYASADDFANDMDALRADGRMRRLGMDVLAHIGADISTVSDALRLLSEIDESAISLARIRRYFLNDSSLDLLEDALASGVPYKYKNLALSGADLTSLGYRGKEVGDALKTALFGAMNGKVKNENDALLRYVLTHKSKL